VGSTPHTGCIFVELKATVKRRSIKHRSTTYQRSGTPDKFLLSAHEHNTATAILQINTFASRSENKRLEIIGRLSGSIVSSLIPLSAEESSATDNHAEDFLLRWGPESYAISFTWVYYIR
jgi:hypothetical protein